MNFVTVTPSYGRDYPNGKAAREDFLAGKDFILQDMFSPYDGKPCSIRDFDMDLTTVTIRYKQLRNVVQVTGPMETNHE
jgi:hypothetical protein